jgi:hypothetical protein
MTVKDQWSSASKSNILTFIATRMRWDEVRYVPHNVINYDPTVLFTRMVFDFLHGNYRIRHDVS